MARGGYRGNNRRNFQNNTRKKKYNVHNVGKSNGKSNFKRKYDDHSKNNLEEKRQKIEEPVQNNEPSSESEEEVENPLSQLLSTFNYKIPNKKTLAIDTDSESSDDEAIEQSESSDDEAIEQSESLDDEAIEQSEVEETNILEDNASDNENSSLSESESDNDSASGESEAVKDENEDISHESDDNEDTEINEEISDNDDIDNDEYVKNEESLQDDEELIEENEIDQDNESEVAKDPFVQHLCYDLSDNLADTMQNTHKKTVHTVEWPWLGKLHFSLPACEEISKGKSNFTIEEDKIYASVGQVPVRIDPKEVDFHELSIKTQIHEHIQPANTELDDDEDGPFTEFQTEIFSIINNYQDLYFTERTFENGEEIRYIYCLHAINHVLKTRTKILHHNARLSKKDDVPEEYRDQGLVRPKVLIIAPFRNSCLKIVENLIALLVPNEAGQVINKNRFMDEFTGGELFMPKKNPKPEDYELNFAGNCDDNFKIGIQVTKKSLKLYADFYSSDIIIASPLGLRITIGAEGEAERDHDFLASIELLILDQTELFLMQNWDHLTHILDHLHIQPKKAHGTDFARVRTWALNGWSRYYRQTLIFSSFALPEINAIFNRRCTNYAGSVKTLNTIKTGTIMNVHVQVPQVFRRFEADSVLKAIEGRFEFFINKVLPQFKDTIMKHTLIYIPSYFDYVKIRNYFKKEDIGFVQICEYTKDPKIARARDYFFHGEKHFMLYSERFHYFRRIRVKGIRHVIFYQPPVFPHFYSEICNFMTEANLNKKSGSASNMTVTVIYSKYDSHQVSAILGTERLAKMAASSNNFHMFTSSDS